MKPALSDRRPGAWLVAGMVWVCLVSFAALWQYGRGEDRLRFWGDVVEETINGDPSVMASAKTVRSRLGDERFIAEAQQLYPQVDLRDVLNRYRSDAANRWRLTFAEWMTLVLLPPPVLYLVGFALIKRAAARNSVIGC